jgi:YqzL-like protein
LRNFVWSCFEVTGSIDAYLLLKSLDSVKDNEETAQKERDEEESG